MTTEHSPTRSDVTSRQSGSALYETLRHSNLTRTPEGEFRTPSMWYRWRNGESDYWRKVAFEPLGEQVVGQLFLNRAEAEPDADEDEDETAAEDDEAGISGSRRRARRGAREPGSEGAFEFEVSGRDPVVLMGIEVIGGSA